VLRANYKFQATSFKAPKFKTQMTNKSQIPRTKTNLKFESLVTLIFPEYSQLFSAMS
jgi:G:T/U-mismatch repair DNA glycosylase